MISVSYTHLDVYKRQTHGLMLGIITPAWMKFCYKKNVPLFARFCVNCLGAKMDFAHPEITIMEGIANFENFVKSIGLPTRLSEIAVSYTHLDVYKRQARMI